MEWYSMYNSVYQYNIDCTLVNEDDGAVLGKFWAREVTPRSLSSAFVNGNIGSLGQNYTIATLDEVARGAEEMRCAVLIGSNKYRLVGKKINALSPIRGYKSVNKFAECVLVLE